MSKKTRRQQPVNRTVAEKKGTDVKKKEGFIGKAVGFAKKAAPTVLAYGGGILTAYAFGKLTGGQKPQTIDLKEGEYIVKDVIKEATERVGDAVTNG